MTPTFTIPLAGMLDPQKTPNSKLLKNWLIFSYELKTQYSILSKNIITTASNHSYIKALLNFFLNFFQVKTAPEVYPDRIKKSGI